MSYKIEKGVPIPPKFANESPFPLRDLKVGDSFVVTKKEASTLKRAVGNYKYHNPGWKYSTRTQPDGGVRVWCLALPDGASTAPAEPPTLRPGRASVERSLASDSGAENPVAAKLREISGKTKPSVHHHGSR